MVFPPHGFLDIVLNMTDRQMRENPPPIDGEITNRIYAMASISMLDTVLNGMSRAQYLIYCERSRVAEIDPAIV